MKTDDGRVRVRFRGPFLGAEVEWDATIVTLEQLWRESGGSPGRPLRPFIDIGPMGEHGHLLTVGLAVPGIDPALEQKTKIMIRNYKRLAPGRHEWGEPWVPPGLPGDERER